MRSSGAVRVIHQLDTDIGHAECIGTPARSESEWAGWLWLRFRSWRHAKITRVSGDVAHRESRARPSPDDLQQRGSWTAACVGLGSPTTLKRTARRRRAPVGGVLIETMVAACGTAGGGIRRGVSGHFIDRFRPLGFSLRLRRMEAFKATTRPGPARWAVVLG
jgi:hypothetical protein